MQKQLKRLNIGSSGWPIRGWINYDNSWAILLTKYPWRPFARPLFAVLKKFALAGDVHEQILRAAWNQDIRPVNVLRGIPVADESAEVIFASHVLEHFDCEEARFFLSEARRVLAPGGIIRIVVPDLSQLAADYLASGDADDFLRRTYLCSGRPKSLLQRARFALVGPRHHLWMYDAGSLTKLLAHHGFQEASVLPPGKTTIPNPGELELVSHHQPSVYVEAKK